MIAALILAAGAGRRMGGPKALLEFEGESLLLRAAKRALGAGCSPVIALVGPWDPGLRDLPVRALVNPQAAEGMASSIRLGIGALGAEVEAALLLTVDQPMVDETLLRALQARFRQDPTRPVACGYAGTLGIPALFPRHLFPELLRLSGDRGAKAVLLRHETVVLPFAQGAQDLDRPSDLDGFQGSMAPGFQQHGGDGQHHGAEDEAGWAKHDQAADH